VAGVGIQLPCTAYTGDEPFAFVSYAHRDAEAVYPEIQRLDLMGYRIWYDEGIDPGNEWPEEVASSLKRSTQFIVFVTQRAIESRNVRNEINYASSENKSVMVVFLQPTELSEGMKLQIGTVQFINKYEMTEADFIEKVKKVLSADLRV
jgi:hypothetical protein